MSRQLTDQAACGHVENLDPLECQAGQLLAIRSPRCPGIVFPPNHRPPAITVGEHQIKRAVRVVVDRLRQRQAIVKKLLAIAREACPCFVEFRCIGDLSPVRTIGTHLEKVPIGPLVPGTENDPAAFVQFSRQLGTSPPSAGAFTSGVGTTAF